MTRYQRLKLFLALCGSFSALMLTVPSWAGTCVPTAAYVTGVADDAVTIWINGVQVGNFSYIDHTSSTPPPVFSFNPAILTTTNTIAVLDQNTSASYDLATWWIDIVCADGTHSYITNADGGYSMYDDTTGTVPPPTCTAPLGIKLGYPDCNNLFTGTPSLVSSTGYSMKNLFNPITGAVMEPISWASTGLDNSANESIYYRKTFPLTETAFTPTTFSINKSPALPAVWLGTKRSLTHFKFVIRARPSMCR